MNGNEYEIILNINKLINKNKPALIVENSKSIVKITKHLKKKKLRDFSLLQQKRIILAEKKWQGIKLLFFTKKTYKLKN